MPADLAAGAHTTDAFHRGDFWLVQPKRAGHRAGMDAMMLAAAVPGSFSGRLADFGAGAGAAGLAVASRCPAARVVLVENAPEMAAYADLTLAYPGNAHLRERAEVLHADVSLAGKARTAAGLADKCAPLHAYCISAATASALGTLEFSRMAVAGNPNQEALLALLPDQKS